MTPALYTKILLIGSGKLAAGIATSLLCAGTRVHLLSDQPGIDEQAIKENIADYKKLFKNFAEFVELQLVPSIDAAVEVDLVIMVTDEKMEQKKELLKKAEQALAPDIPFAVNADSFLLEELQADMRYPERLVLLNWCDPVHLNSFLEIVVNPYTPVFLAEGIKKEAKQYWQKDPYITNGGYSVRARLMAALTREAFYLVENGYASTADIDRACRNDAGYYLPFAGNCRYMDLMGTYAYGLVMKDLNRELSKAAAVPAFFSELVETGKNGMENHAGFYNYAAADVEWWQHMARKFGVEIKEVMDKYPFQYSEEDVKKKSSKITLDE